VDALPRSTPQRRTDFEIYPAAYQEANDQKMSLLEPLRGFLASRSVHAYLVGGAVRDMLLHRDTHDLDIAVQGSASQLARAFADEIGAAFFLMDESFDVARVILDTDDGREIVDFARLRGDSIEQDLGTRDVTINAIAADALAWNGEPGDLIDPFHGRADIEARQVRAISDNVFKNDAVRLFRAARMEAELDFVLDPTTEQMVKRDAPLIEHAPMERVRDEFVKIIGALHALRNLRRLDTLDLLGRVVPEVNAMRGVTQSPPHAYDVFEHTLHAVGSADVVERENYMNLGEGAFGTQLREHFSQPLSGGRTRREWLRFALLLHDMGKPATRTVDANGRIRYFDHEKVGAEMVGRVLRRLKCSNDEVDHVRTIIRHHMRPLNLALSGGATDRAAHRFFRDTGDVGVDVVIHSWCDQRGTGQGEDTEETVATHAVFARLLDRYYHARTQVISPPTLLNGDDIMQELGLSPGRHIRDMLTALAEAQAVGEVTNREQALDYIKKFDPPA
jgi:tRNA nucleotidyltransferase/poly(A) polymerase